MAEIIKECSEGLTGKVILEWGWGRGERISSVDILGEKHPR